MLFYSVHISVVSEGPGPELALLEGIGASTVLGIFQLTFIDTKCFQQGKPGTLVSVWTRYSDFGLA